MPDSTFHFTIPSGVEVVHPTGEGIVITSYSIHYTKLYDFNFEGGCYAKVIKLSAVAEPEIYETTRRFGTILENVAMNYGTRRIDLDSYNFV